MMSAIKAWVFPKVLCMVNLIILNLMELILTNLPKEVHLFHQICNTITNLLNLMELIT